MSAEYADAQKVILEQLSQITTEVRHIPRFEAQIDAMRGATAQLETAMRETTASLQMQSAAHGKLIDELRLQVHQSISGMMGISNDVQGLLGRVKDLERQVAAIFQQHLQLSKDVREMWARETLPALTRHLEDYQALCDKVEDLPKLEKRIVDIEADLKKRIDPEELQTLATDVADNRPWMTGIKWFLRILFYALAAAAVTGLLWLLGQALVNAL